MNRPTERELLEATRRLLRESERACDDLTVARLRAGRLRALEAKRGPLRGWWPWAGGIATAGMVAALAGTLWFNVFSDSPLSDKEQTIVADVDLLTTQENLEFYTEIEFYDWLASEPDAG